jgi:deoxyadenosine/deoxycytidine kinase
MSQPIIISIEGNIGAGKSTILEELRARMGESSYITFVKEPVDIWETVRDEDGKTILEKFYEDSKKYAFQFQVMALTTRLSLIRNTVRTNPECKVIICERSVDADKQIFAKMLHADGIISYLDYKVYCLLATEHSRDFIVDGYVYINADAEVCHRRVAKRSRTGESQIELEYLQKCKKYHDDWLNNYQEWECNRDRMQTRVLNLNTNADVSYNKDDDADVGNRWINDIERFINDIILAKQQN